jgi:hypothetical protein
MKKQTLDLGETLNRSEQLSIVGGNSSTADYPPQTYPVYPPMPV